MTFNQLPSEQSLFLLINFIRKKMKKALLTGFLFFTVMLITAGVSYAAKIHLKNGSVIGCKIIAFDD